MLERVDNSWSSSGEEKAEERRAERSRAGPSGDGQRRKTASRGKNTERGEKVSTVVVRVSTL